jgi:predicted SprT family Zn-dependent metalloprotease
MNLAKEKYFTRDCSTNLKEIKDLAWELLETTFTIDIYRHGEPKNFKLADLGWTFEFNSRKRAAGLCSWGKKTIFISKYLLSQNLDKAVEFENTIRHEIAHAIDFEMRGRSDHSKIWKAIAHQVLCNGERCYSGEVIQTKVKTKYTLKCVEDGCDYERPSHKRLKVNARSRPCCTTCYNAGKGYQFLVQVQNY